MSRALRRSICNLAARQNRRAIASKSWPKAPQSRKHSYDQALADFNRCRELLAPGGCMVFHDYGFGKHHGQPDFHPGVTRTIDEHVLNDSDFRPLLLAHTLFAFVKIAR